ncbi:hypothetical protein K8Z61_18520 [Nocardioides sp. TRM66260-LWL]|uniref:hypothetical protein n=1 Tax=Nocardioides sp. TRM66260-LWL TaxID=2874478 RepID=UPI001CC8267A|nr:hypothetical protein [Nocardioides sp. TRM66260-LWL]MBZ5736490.1 hypothetical protein [Nocardioides sp. TRM66260-LWL]
MTHPTGLAALVDRDQVQARLSERAPRAFEAEVGEGVDLVDVVIAGVCAEVTAVAGSGIAERPGPKLDLAVLTAVYGAAMEIEADLYPEQGRVTYLRERYEAMLDRLKNYVDPADDGNSDGVPSPIGNFPAPMLGLEEVIPVVNQPYGWDGTPW